MALGLCGGRKEMPSGPPNRERSRSGGITLGTYALRRSLEAIPLLLVISLIIYFILSKAPGGVLGPYLANPHITPADLIRLKHNLGADQPFIVQYVRWLGKVLTGDFGYSTSNAEPVLQAIWERFPATLELTTTAFLLAVIVGVGAGIFSSLRPYSFADYFITTFAFFGQSMPVFWFALMMQLLFSVHGIPLPFGYQIKLPSSGLGEGDSFNLGSRISHLILPAIVLGLLQLATFSRFARSSMLEVLKTDYMRTALAKGLDFRTVLLKHGLKNAVVPLVTVAALSLPGLVSGAVVTETIFAWPGMGRLFFNGLQQQDVSLMMGYLCMVAFLVVFMNLFADLAYAWLDPRVRYD